jgi:hypothetical protein
MVFPRLNEHRGIRGQHYSSLRKGRIIGVSFLENFFERQQQDGLCEYCKRRTDKVLDKKLECPNLICHQYNKVQSIK